MKYAPTIHDPNLIYLRAVIWACLRVPGAVSHLFPVIHPWLLYLESVILRCLCRNMVLHMSRV